MLNGVFVFLVVASLLLAGYNGTMQEWATAIFQSARSAVDIAFNLVGVMALFLGLMKVVEDAGMLRILARVVSPVMRLLFPTIPPGHPAMSAMVLNISANMLGLANAATPFGIKAMEELDELNGEKGTASNAMCLFLALNTAGLAILPSGVAGIRASLGSTDPWGIWLPTLFASGCATVVGITAAFLFSRLPVYRRTEPPTIQPDQREGELGELIPAVRWKQVAAGLFWLTFFGLLIYGAVKEYGVLVADGAAAPGIELAKSLLSSWSLAAVIAFLVLFGWVRGGKVYDSLVEGAKSGFEVFVRIVPFLVAILVAVGMFRASGGIDLIEGWIGGALAAVGMPTEALSMALLRPLTGSGALGVMAAVMEQHGPDTQIGYLVSTMQGSTETTFYVLAVYFGAVKVKRGRHALPACLCADVAGITAAVFIVNLLFG